jgi:hypothetical protein
MGNRRENVMSGIDKTMIPITIAICLVAIAPIVAPDLNIIKEQSEPFSVNKIQESEIKSKQYFENLENNVEDTKEIIRDLMAEHQAKNP